MKRDDAVMSLRDGGIWDEHFFAYNKDDAVMSLRDSMVWDEK